MTGDDNDPWLPPRSREASGTLGDHTPETHRPPELADVSPDDPVVVALTLPPPLTPIDDYEETPPPCDPRDPVVLERKAQLTAVAEAALRRNFVEQRPDEQSMSERLFVLELWKTQADLDIRNLTALVKELLRRNVAG